MRFLDWFRPRNAFYLVSYSYYDEYEPFLLKGPRVDNWEKFCDDLIPLAVDVALKKTDANEGVGWPQIVDGLVEILESKGYQKVIPEEASYWGNNVICEDHNDEPDLTEELIEKICKRNASLVEKEKEIFKQHESEAARNRPSNL